jgi:hypothetical protein
MITRMNNMILMLDMSAIIIVKITDIPAIPPIIMFITDIPQITV